jgi:nucleoside-diphosphate-sugar epimerase
MSDSSTVLILGAHGRLGSACVQAFDDAGWQVIAQQRKPAGQASAQTSHPRIQTLVTGAAPVSQLANSLPTVDVVVHAMNPAYTNAAWVQHVPGMMDSAITLASALKATLIFPGNVYNFGRHMPPVLTENLSQHPTSVKGRLRAEIEQKLRCATQATGLRAVVIRAGDFFGSGRGSWFDQVLTSKLQRGTFTYPGPLDVATPWAYLPDLAKTFVRVAGHRQQLPDFETLHFAGHQLSGADWLRALQPLAEAQGWGAAGQPLKTASLPWSLIRAVGLVNSSWASLAEVRYLYQTPHALGNAGLVKLLGAEPHTALPEAAAQALAELGLLSARSSINPSARVSAVR